MEGCVKAKAVGEEWLEEKRFESCFGDGHVWIGPHVFVWVSAKQSLRQRLGAYNQETRVKNYTMRLS